MKLSYTKEQLEKALSEEVTAYESKKETMSTPKLLEDAALTLFVDEDEDSTNAQLIRSAIKDLWKEGTLQYKEE